MSKRVGQLKAAQKLVRCSQIDLATGSLEYFVVSQAKNRGCWLSSEELDLSTFILHRSARIQSYRDNRDKQLKEINARVDKDFNRILKQHEDQIVKLMKTCTGKGFSMIPTELIQPCREKHFSEMKNVLKLENCITLGDKVLYEKIFAAEAKGTKAYIQSLAIGSNLTTEPATVTTKNMSQHVTSSPAMTRFSLNTMSNTNPVNEILNESISIPQEMSLEQERTYIEHQRQLLQQQEQELQQREIELQKSILQKQKEQIQEQEIQPLQQQQSNTQSSVPQMIHSNTAQLNNQQQYNIPQQQPNMQLSAPQSINSNITQLNNQQQYNIPPPNAPQPYNMPPPNAPQPYNMPQQNAPQQPYNIPQQNAPQQPYNLPQQNAPQQQWGVQQPMNTQQHFNHWQQMNIPPQYSPHQQMNMQHQLNPQQPQNLQQQSNVNMFQNQQQQQYSQYQFYPQQQLNSNPQYQVPQQLNTQQASVGYQGQGNNYQDQTAQNNNNNFIPDTGITSNTMITRNVDGFNVSNSINNSTQWESNEANAQTQFDSTYENSCEV